MPSDWDMRPTVGINQKRSELLKKVDKVKPMEIRWEDFTPPFGLTWHIRRALTWIDPVDLHGIDHIFLFEDIPEVSKQGDPDVERAIGDNLLICGAYRARRATRAAHVILIVKSLYHPMPGIFVHTPAMTLSIAQTIAHEVGHHLIAEKRFALRPKPGGELESEEEFANRYAQAVTGKMRLQPLYRFGGLLNRLAAALNYYRGVRAWKKKKYTDAAAYFDMATDLEPNHAEASYWFWRAKERAVEQKEQSDPIS